MASNAVWAIHRRLWAALDNVEESFALLRADVIADADVCQDLLEQLECAKRAAEEWQAFIDAGGAVH